MPLFDPAARTMSGWAVDELVMYALQEVHDAETALGMAKRMTGEAHEAALLTVIQHFVNATRAQNEIIVRSAILELVPDALLRAIQVQSGDVPPNP